MEKVYDVLFKLAFKTHLLRLHFSTSPNEIDNDGTVNVVVDTRWFWQRSK